ncbi:uncharacterized protein A1O9_12725 [Exophiala aquamarina CBS 119918]|uniref:Xaa-Pro dipeptidyl-peptidase C-terminal domain-containing protein n=1 Tax=Exophiala aquamarina CBS 119918 TaxID=1182545 RepID=A0A072NV20_9EURO|nr:uncharacterized protein A1O9_12725 [Exophiala aquamarina CBS 119918]KEF51222.1 hypothetical protein A1O9_12725 [Exophiala aquamarina CBS 119918]
MGSLRKVGDIEVLHVKSTPVGIAEKPTSQYNGFSPSKILLPRGHKLTDSNRSFPVDTIWERDIAITMRDGVKLYADVFRPSNESLRVPAIMVWSPYGKTGTGYFSLDNIPCRVGVPKANLSGYEKFEGPDPAEWIQHDYAIVNVDPRGVFASEGDICFFGTAEGRDGFDTIEHLAKLRWCNGKVATMGNSWLASAQWFIAAERPPSLACMLPLEGLSDFYRENFCRGGVPNSTFFGPYMFRRLFGNSKTEDVASMLKLYPFMNGYWLDKRAKIEEIRTPAYVLASMSTCLHTVGSLRGFEEIPHEKKWLRLHPTQEWHDLYKPESNADFKKFLDFYTKGIENDWESTAKARISVLRYNEPPLYNLSFSTWPIPETQWRSLRLSSNWKLTEDSPDSGKASYQADIVGQQDGKDQEELSFTFTFPERCTLIGPARATLYVSCAEHDEMDVFVQIRKADKDGNVLSNSNIPLHELGKSSLDEVPEINVLKYLGPTGVLRASHRAIDPSLTKPHWTAHDHTKEAKITPGEIVKLDIGIWPASIQWSAGERLVFKVAGHSMTLAEFPVLQGTYTTANKGKHTLYFGEEYKSSLQIPVVII